MSEKSVPGGRAEREAEKARRLSDALRANLARRKARQRSKAAEGAESDDPIRDAGAGSPEE